MTNIAKYIILNLTFFWCEVRLHWTMKSFKHWYYIGVIDENFKVISWEEQDTFDVMMSSL
jgi:hypothetical protein